MNKKILAFLDNNSIEYIENLSMKDYTSFKIGGNASLAIFPKTLEETKIVVDWLIRANQKYITLGNCSNIIVDDSGIACPIIFTSKLKDVFSQGEGIVCYSGMLLSQAAHFAYTNALSGLEFAHGIPGSVGGAVYMNAGAYGKNISDVVENTVFIDSCGEIKEIKNDAHLYGYRKSVFTDKDIIIYTKFKLEKADKEDIKSKMDLLMEKRKASQPLSYPSAGSVFKRPEGYYAGTLIEQSGLKGFSVGGAQVSTKHAGFIINTGNATAKDVSALICHIQETVYKKFGVNLETEVKFIV